MVVDTWRVFTVTVLVFCVYFEIKKYNEVVRGRHRQICFPSTNPLPHPQHGHEKNSSFLRDDAPATGEETVLVCVDTYWPTVWESRMPG